jgi:Cu/Ag efflux protein CusF
MTRYAKHLLVIGLGVAAAAVAAAQEPVTKTQSVSATATIQAIDATGRLITLRDEKGQEDTFSVSPAVKRFDELKVGDKVKLTYYESLVMQVNKPGDPAPSGASTEAGLARGKGALPGATLAVQDKTSVTVKSIDAAVPSVTVTTADGRTVTRKIENKKYLEGLKVGDVVSLTYTRALVADIERAK